jgi:hypothetical protein
MPISEQVDTLQAEIDKPPYIPRSLHSYSLKLISVFQQPFICKPDLRLSPYPAPS